LTLSAFVSAPFFPVGFAASGLAGGGESLGAAAVAAVAVAATGGSLTTTGATATFATALAAPLALSLCLATGTATCVIVSGSSPLMSLHGHAFPWRVLGSGSVASESMSESNVVADPYLMRNSATVEVGECCVGG
jgi:hypothetical protein